MLKFKLDEISELFLTGNSKSDIRSKFVKPFLKGIINYTKVRAHGNSNSVETIDLLGIDPVVNSVAEHSVELVLDHHTKTDDYVELIFISSISNKLEYKHWKGAITDYVEAINANSDKKDGDTKPILPKEILPYGFDTKIVFLAATSTNRVTKDIEVQFYICGREGEIDNTKSSIIDKMMMI